MFSLGKLAGVVIGNSEVKSRQLVTNMLLAQNQLTLGNNDRFGAAAARLGDDLDGGWCGREGGGIFGQLALIGNKIAGQTI